MHVVSSVKFAIKAEKSGVDAIVAEGFEAGGHNGREETTTMTLIPLIKKFIQIPLIAAGGIGSGEAMLALRLYYCLGCAAFFLPALFLTWFYPLTKEKHQELRLELESQKGD